MAEAFEAELKITGIGDAVRDLNQLQGELEDTGRHGESSGESMKEFGTKVAGAAVAVGAVVAVINKAVEALVAFGEEYEHQAAILNRFNGSLDEARERTNGLVSDLGLMTERNRAAAAGLDLSGRSLANIAVASQEMAASIGGDGAEAFEKLTRAVANAEEGALREFDIQVGGITDGAERQAEALRQLEARYGEMETRADTLGGKIRVLSVELDNAETEMFETLEMTNAMTDAFDRIGVAIESVVGEFDDLNDEGFTFGQTVGIGISAVFDTIADRVEHAAEQLNAYIAALQSAASGNLQQAATELAAAVTADDFNYLQALNENVADQTRQLMLATATRDALRDSRDANGDQTSSIRGPSASASSGAEEAFGNEGYGALMAANAADVDELMRDIANTQDDMAAKEWEFLEAKQAEYDLAILMKEKDEERLQIQNDAADAREREEEQLARITAGTTTAVSILGDAIESSIKGEKKFGKALKQSLGEWLKGFAKQEALRGAVEVAMGIGKVLIPGKQGEAGGHFTSAAMHFGIAAAAGGGGAAMSSGGGGGGGSAMGPSSGPQSDSGGGGGGSIVVNINSPMPESEVGEMAARADRAYRSRQSSGRGL